MHDRHRVDPLSRFQAPSHPRRGARDRAGRRVIQLEPAELLRHEVPARQGLPRHPGQSQPRRPGAAGRARLRLAARHPRAHRHGGHLPRVRPGGPDRGRRHRDWRADRVDAARRAQRRRRRARRAGRAGRRDEPLPEDRVRPPGRGAVVERRQLRYHPQPCGAAADRRTPPPRRRTAGREPRPRLRDPRHPRRRRARSHHRRAHHADLPDRIVCIRRRRARRLTLQPAQFRLHLRPPEQPHRLGAGGARRQPGGRTRRRRRRVGPRRAVPGVRDDAGAGRRIYCVTQPLWRLAHAVRPVVP